MKTISCNTCHIQEIWNSERWCCFLCIPLISKWYIHYFAIHLEEGSRTWRKPTQTLKKCTKSAQEGIRAVDQTQRQKHTQTAALPSLFQITHQIWDVILKSSLRINSNPRQQLYLHTFSSELSGNLQINMVAAVIWETLKVWKMLDAGFLN